MKYAFDPRSWLAIERTRPALPKLTNVQKVRKAACPRLAVITPSNLHTTAISPQIAYSAADARDCISIPHRTIESLTEYKQ